MTTILNKQNKIALVVHNLFSVLLFAEKHSSFERMPFKNSAMLVIQFTANNHARSVNRLAAFLQKGDPSDKPSESPRSNYNNHEPRQRDTNGWCSNNVGYDNADNRNGYANNVDKVFKHLFFHAQIYAL